MSILTTGSDTFLYISVICSLEQIPRMHLKTKDICILKFFLSVAEIASRRAYQLLFPSIEYESDWLWWDHVIWAHAHMPLIFISVFLKNCYSITYLKT